MTSVNKKKRKSKDTLSGSKDTLSGFRSKIIKINDEFPELKKCFTKTVMETATRGDRNNADVLISHFTGSKIFLLQFACYWGWKDMVKTLYNDTETIIIQDSKYINKCFAYSVMRGHIDIVKYLISKGTDPSKNIIRWFPLSIASFFGHLDIVKLLLKDKRVDPNISNGNFSPFNIACFKGHYGIVEEFCKDERIIKTNLVNFNNFTGKKMTSIHLAASKNHSFVVKLLIDNGVDPNLQCFNNLNALFFAVYKGNCAAAKVLLDNGADINAVDKYLNTPLHFACMNGDENMVTLLTSYPNLIQKKNKKSQIPWDAALKSGKTHIIKILERFGFSCEENILPIDIDDVFRYESEEDFIFKFSKEEIKFLQSVLA